MDHLRNFLEMKFKNGDLEKPSLNKKKNKFKKN